MSDPLAPWLEREAEARSRQAHLEDELSDDELAAYRAAGRAWLATTPEGRRLRERAHRLIAARTAQGA